jgi:signal peptidase II
MTDSVNAREADAERPATAVPAGTSPGHGSRPTILWFWITALALLVLDLVSKAIVSAEMPIAGPHVEVIGDVFRLRHIRNSGGLFGLFPGNAIYFAGVSAIAVAVIVLVIYRSRERERLQQVALGLVLGGALGNLHDRVRFHEVVDFLDVGIGAHRWPTFNVADSGVTVGVSVLVVWLFLTERRAHRHAGEACDDPDVEARAADGSS